MALGLTAYNFPKDYWTQTDAGGRPMGDPYYGMPEYPGYNPQYNPSSMAIAPEINRGLGMINPDQRGLEAYRNQALRTGPSTWADLASAKSYEEEGRSRDILGREAAGNAATARGTLASRGGLRSGAAERIQTSTNRDVMGASQNLAAQGNANRMQIGINDEQNRIAQLGALPGMEQNQGQFDLQKLGTYGLARQADIGNQYKENKALNDYNLGVYQAGTGAWAANKQAQATENSGGSWLCTEARKRGCKNPKYNGKDAERLKTFRKYALTRNPEVTRFYLYRCNELVNRMVLAGDVDWKKIFKFIRSILFHVEQGSMQKAFQEYEVFTRKLIKKYWPECDHPVYLMAQEKAA